MSQRLVSKIKPASNVEALLPFVLNGFLDRGISGSAPDDDGDKDSDDDTDDGDDDGQDGSEGQQDGKTDDDKDDAAERLSKMEARMKAADRRAAEAEKRAKAYEDKDKGELEKATERAAELEETAKALQTEVSDLRLANAFLSSNTISWHDPEIAMSKADLSEVLNENGEIDKKALKKALEALAKEKPFLVKSSTDADDPDDGEDAPPSAPPVGAGQRKTRKAVDEDALRRKYPALGRR